MAWVLGYRPEFFRAYFLILCFSLCGLLAHCAPLTSELFPLRSSDHDCCWDTLLKTLHQSRHEINGKCKCKQTSNEYRQTPPNTQCCILLEILPLLYILFPTKQKIYIHYQLVYLPNIDSSISTAKLSPPSMYLWHDWNIFSAITSLIKTNIAKSTTDSRVEFCLPK